VGGEARRAQPPLGRFARVLTTDELKAALDGVAGYRHRLEANQGAVRLPAGRGDGCRAHPAPPRPERRDPHPEADPAQARPGGSKVDWTKEDSDKVIRWLERRHVRRRRATGKDLFTAEVLRERFPFNRNHHADDMTHAFAVSFASVVFLDAHWADLIRRLHR
jgi:hypothetical protein